MASSEKQVTNLLLAGGGVVVPGVTGLGQQHRALHALVSWVSMALYKIQYFFVLP